MRKIVVLVALACVFALLACSARAQPTCEVRLQALGLKPTNLQLGAINISGLSVPILPGDTATGLCNRIDTLTTQMVTNAAKVQKLTQERDRAVARANDLQRLVDNQNILQRNYAWGWVLGIGWSTFFVGIVAAPFMTNHLNSGRRR